MPTFQEKHQGGEEEQAAVDVGVIKMKKIRLFISFLVLVETRSVLPKLVSFSGVLLKPVPCLMKSIHAWLPATTGVMVTHALSGATTEVQSNLGSSITLKVGEELDYQFYTSRYSAQSFEIEGLPEGLSTDLSYGSGRVSGKVSQAGNYTIEITGFRYQGYAGSATPTYTLIVNVEAKEASIPSYFTPNELNDLGNAWYESTWFGLFYNPENSPWLYHQKLGWLYGESNEVDTIWFYDSELQWLYTTKELYPYFFRNYTQSWLYHIQDSSSYRFWDYSSKIKVF